MGRFVAGTAPEAEALVADALVGIGREVDAMRVPGLDGVVLGGGYGRGEGGVREVESGEWRVESGGRRVQLSNDLDFFAITADGASDADAAAIAVRLEPVSRRWTERLGIDVDFTARTPWRLRHDQERLMVQELLHGYVDVAGRKGEELFAGIERREPGAFPWMEAARLMMNRGVGLLLAQEAGRPRDFVARNLNKCILGAGDAFLISRGRYQWRATERAAALKARSDGGLYARALEWKFRPGEEPVCDWETARECWLDAKLDVTAAVDETSRRRTLRHAARWLARRRTVGALATFGQDPVLRVLDGVTRCIETRAPLAPALKRDWEIFN